MIGTASWRAGVRQPPEKEQLLAVDSSPGAYATWLANSSALSVPRPFVSGAAAEHLLRARADFRGNGRHARVGGHHHSCLLAERFHDPAALAYHLVLFAADCRQRIGVVLLELLRPIAAVVIEQAVREKITVELGGQRRRCGLDVLLDNFGDSLLQEPVLRDCMHAGVNPLVDLASQRI